MGMLKRAEMDLVWSSGLGFECSVEMLLWVFGLWNFIYSLVDYCWFL